MNRYSLLTFATFLLFISSELFGQAIAMDFTRQDCDGTDHHFFSELDAGNVVILDFIMLNCAPCIVASKAMESIVASYEQSHPGRVKIYSFGFLDSYTCEQLLAWKSTNGFRHTTFSGGEGQVAYYGGMGMPTIVVTGSDSHAVFYKGIGYTSAHDVLIRAAIDSALKYNPTGIGEPDPLPKPHIYPTLFTDHLNIHPDHSYDSPYLQLEDVSGRIIFSGAIPSNGRVSLPHHFLAPGLYLARIRDGHGVSAAVKLIRQ